MIPTVAFLSALLTAQANSAPRLALINQQWVAIFGTKKYYSNVQSNSAQAPQSAEASFRKDDAFVVWTKDELKLRKGKELVTSKLDFLVTDDRWFTREQIAMNQHLLRFGGYVSPVHKLLAQRRVGSLVFLLLRWETPQGTSWFDGLIQVDLGSKKLQVKPIARFKNVFPIRNSSSIPVVTEQLIFVEQLGDTWSIAKVSLAKNSVSKKTMGTVLSDFLLGSGQVASFVESASDGSDLIGWTDLKDLSRSNLYETKGEIRALDAQNPWVGALRDEVGLSLLSMETGAKLKIALDRRVARIGEHIVVWSGGTVPTQAELYESTRWRRIAEWKAPATKPAKPVKKP